MVLKKVGRTTPIGVQLDPTKVRMEMRRRGWQQKDLARAAQLSQMTISNILRGYPCFGATAAAIQKAFEGSAPVLDNLIDRRTA